MKFILLLYLGMLVSAPPTIAGIWTQEQIDQVFDLVRTGHTEDAIWQLEMWGVSANNFGLDLLQQGRGNDALFWTEATSEFSFRTSRIWALGVLGRIDEAQTLIDQVLQDGTALEIARANYLGAVFALQAHDTNQAHAYAYAALEYYEQQNRQKGINLCMQILESSNKSVVGGQGVPQDPPFDNFDE